jgi:hypothetical protein
MELRFEKSLTDISRQVEEGQKSKSEVENFKNQIILRDRKIEEFKSEYKKKIDLWKSEMDSLLDQLS